MDETLKDVEDRLASLGGTAPRELRAAVLRDVGRELTAARWDRRLARAAAVLLVVGVGMNGALVLRSSHSVDGRQTQIARAQSRESIVETAVVVAEATDADTGRRFARQLAAMRGRELSSDDAAAIDAALERAAPHTRTNGNRG
jgi:hypothetical protein